jgi:FkbM family methyltransferase
LTKINFKKNINFWEISSFAKTKKIDHLLALQQASEQNVLFEKNKDLLKKFINSFDSSKNIKSQLYQDVFASFIIGNKFEKTFLEFGATDGLELSNTYMLENSESWRGVLSEPSPQWHNLLKKNRANTKIITKCIWSESGKKLDFFMSDAGVLSTINKFIESDKNSMPGNTFERKKSGKVISVETISLNDVIEEYFNKVAPSYISIDTEGSEYEILSTFKLDIYRPKVFTIEHNFTDYQNKIDHLMNSQNYIRIFRDLTAFDAWYVSGETLKELDF